MKKNCISTLLISGVFLISFLAARAGDVPFSRGVNLTNWFQAAGTTEIDFSKYTKKDFEQVKSLGCDVIRLPINLHSMTNGTPDYVIDTLFYDLLDQVVDWATDLNINLILDNHTFDPAVSTPATIGPVLIKVWSQMAEHYKNSSDYIFYEVLNEPHGISDNAWNTIQQQVINTIRETDTTHYIVVGGAGWNSYNNLNAIPVYTDSKLIYTFHFYDPFIFTHQGASWTDPSMAPLDSVPFPFIADSMPDFPASLNGTWIKTSFNDYSNTGKVSNVKALLDIAIHFKNSRNVPVFCGEFGVYMPNSANHHRIFWYETVRNYLEENGIAWTTWDYHGDFGLFRNGSNGLFEHDLNVPLLQSLGFDIPEQTPYEQKPDSTGFMLYTDLHGDGILKSRIGEGTLTYYSSEHPNNGSYCIYWTGSAQYDAIGFTFKTARDFSRLVEEGYALDLMVRGNSTQTTFDVRFIDTKTGSAEDHPWRTRITVDASLMDFNRQWQHVFIPLNQFTEQGSWDNAWFEPEGKFDWSAIDRFEIVSEQQGLGNKKLWFDNIHITNQDTAQVYDFSVITGFHSSLSGSVQIYPNPANDYIYITTNAKQPVSLKITDIAGRIYEQTNYNSGEVLDVSDVPAGIYLLYLYSHSELISVNKIIVQ